MTLAARRMACRARNGARILGRRITIVQADAGENN